MTSAKKTASEQTTLDTGLERYALKSLLTEFLLRDGVILPEDLRNRNEEEVDRHHAMIGALELLGGFRPGAAETAHDRANKETAD